MMREWMSEPIDDRPVIGNCEVCGCEIHGSSPGDYGDCFYDFFGELVCEDHLTEYCNRVFKKGD